MGIISRLFGPNEEKISRTCVALDNIIQRNSAQADPSVGWRYNPEQNCYKITVRISNDPYAHPTAAWVEKKLQSTVGKKIGKPNQRFYGFEDHNNGWATFSVSHSTMRRYFKRVERSNRRLEQGGYIDAASTSFSVAPTDRAPLDSQSHSRRDPVIQFTDPTQDFADSRELPEVTEHTHGDNHVMRIKALLQKMVPGSWNIDFDHNPTTGKITFGVKLDNPTPTQREAIQSLLLDSHEDTKSGSFIIQANAHNLETLEEARNSKEWAQTQSPSQSR